MINDSDVLFPHVIWKGNIDNLDNNVIKEYALEKIKNKRKNPLMKDERPWDSTDLFLEECSQVKKLVDKLNDCMALICEDVGFHAVQLYNIWINRNPPGVENPVHTHLHHDGRLGALFSGVWYLDADENLDQGDIIFERSDKSEMHIPKLLIKEVTSYNIPRTQYKSKLNDLYIFNSWIPHRVSKNNSDKDRFSISFNYGV